ncbi:hypothetical protein NQ315_016304 [Exocentrus adspersus]|uniref:Carbohydrate kinase PfkB domain-containing protein n=1 Tax=Exocentrus adspersus TaxID=1586481 RepID=A0AAV8VQ50_9CUCU|nr:hypothetical protein NQ315_016304 [Exocentrus adspersus]
MGASKKNYNSNWGEGGTTPAYFLTQSKKMKATNGECARITVAPTRLRRLRPTRRLVHLLPDEDVQNFKCYEILRYKRSTLDGRIYPCRFSYSPGGVGRNICDSLSKLGHVPKFLSAVGDDYQGTILSKSIPLQSSNFLKVLKGRRTAQCIIVFDKRGDCRLLMGDMEVHAEISPKLIQENEVVIKTAPLVVLDANLSVESVEEALKLATKYSIPVVFEPTDVEIADKPFRTPYWKAVKLITPNLNELRHITSTFLENRPNKPISYKSNTVEEAAYLAKQLAGYIENVIVTLGSSGVLVARKALAIDPFLNYQQTKEVHLRHYPCTVVKDFVNVSGAGDCLASGIIAGVLRGLPETQCLSIGFTAAETALYTQSAVPDKIFEQGHQCWNTSAKFETLQL